MRLFLVLLCLWTTIQAAAFAAESRAESEQAFKEAMGLSEYASVTYQDAAGAPLSFDAFTAQVGSGKKFSMLKNATRRSVVLSITSDSGKNPTSGMTISVPLGGAMPEAPLRDTRGVAHTWKGFDGRPVLLDFFFSECLPCVREVPILNDFAKHNTDVAVLAITFDDVDLARKFAAKYGFEWPIVADASGFIGRVGVQAYPMLLLVDPDGKLVGSKAGGVITPDQQGKERAALEAWVGGLR